MSILFWKDDQSCFSQFLSSLVTYLSCFGTYSVISSILFLCTPLLSLWLFTLPVWVISRHECLTSVYEVQSLVCNSCCWRLCSFSTSHSLHFHRVGRAYFCYEHDLSFFSLSKQNLTFVCFQHPSTCQHFFCPQTCLP